MLWKTQKFLEGLASEYGHNRDVLPTPRLELALLKDRAQWAKIGIKLADEFARKWESALLVNVDNDTLRRVLDNPEAMAAVERIEGWRSLGDNIIETIINKSEKVKELKNKAKDKDPTEKQQRQLTDEEKEYKSKRKLVQEKLIKFATRIPAFMYLTDFRENTLQDVITRLEPELFLAVTGLTV